MDITNKRILDIALPSIVSNITVPLLGLIDVMIVGHLGATSYIGAIAVGGMLFNIIYWIFGFLRMGTGGMVSQAFGRKDEKEIIRLLLRSVSIGLSVAFVLILLQYPIRKIAFTFIEATPDVRANAELYFHICIWGAPAVLGLYSFNGWFIGMQNSRIPMMIAITQNIVNILASLCFVFLLKMKIEGVALGTMIAQYAGFLMAFGLWFTRYADFRRRVTWDGVFESSALIRFFKINRDIFFRTICLVAVTVYFTSAGSAQGEVILAVNTLLMQLFTLFSYFMDGFAYAGEALTGRFIGAEDRESLRHTIRDLFRWGIALSALFTLIYAVGGTPFLRLLTDDTVVLEAVTPYYYWVLAIPFAGFAAFLYDGIFIGATATRMMFHSMLVATITFFILYFAFRGMLGNHALWMAFITYLILRGVMQGWLGKKIIS